MARCENRTRSPRGFLRCTLEVGHEVDLLSFHTIDFDDVEPYNVGNPEYWELPENQPIKTPRAKKTLCRCYHRICGNFAAEESKDSSLCLECDSRGCRSEA